MDVDSNHQTDSSSVGPAGLTSNGDRTWERAWSVDEMRQSADNWSLAGDAGLLLHLQQFSQKIISRTHDIQLQVDKLAYDIKQSGVRVDNVFNDFISLANTQFVENRVYDEDTSQESKEEEKKEGKEQSREEKEAELVPKISEAVKLGLSVLDSAFENLDINQANSDSEEDDGTPYKTDPILEPKDPYVHRSLPYIIGSSAFMQDDDVGLVDMPSDAEESDDQGSVSESGSETEESSSDESQDEDAGSIKKPEVKQTRPFAESDSESGSDLFDEKDEAEETNNKQDGGSSSEEDDEEPKAAVPFASELASKIGAIHGQPPDESPVTKTRSKSKSKKEKALKKQPEESDDLFGAQDEPEDDSPFGRKGGMFSSGGGLFGDDEEEEDDLFAEVTRKSKKKEVKKVSSESEDEVIEKPTQQPKVSKEVKTGGLFSDEDDDLFGAPPPRKTEQTTSKPPVKSSEKSKSFFDNSESEDDMFADQSHQTQEKEIAKPEKKMPAGAVSIFGKGAAGNSLADALKGRKQASSESENSDDEWADESSDKTSRESKNVKEEKSAISKEPTKTMSKPKSFLDDYDDDDDDDLFSIVKKSPKKDTTSRPKSNSLLFDDDTSELFSAGSPTKVSPVAPTPKKEEVKTEQPKAAISLFDDDGSDDDLFGPGPSKSKPAAKPTNKPQKKSMFDDEENDLFQSAKDPQVDLFGPSSPIHQNEKEETQKPEVKTVTKKTSGPLMLDSKDDDLFGSKSARMSPAQTTKALKKEEPKVIKPKPQTVSTKSAPLMFGSDDDDEDDLFGSKPTKTEPPAPVKSKESVVAKPIKTTSPPALSSDDDDMFSQAKPSAPSTTEGKNTRDTTDAKPSGPRKPAGAVSMFGGINPADILKKRGLKAPSPESSDDEVNDNDPPKANPPITTGAKPKTSVPLFVPPMFAPPMAKPQTQSQVSGVSFDQDTSSSKTLDSVQKNRARIQTKRRPPTRRGRQSATEKEGSSIASKPSVGASPTKEVEEKKGVIDGALKEQPARSNASALVDDDDFLASVSKPKSSEKPDDSPNAPPPLPASIAASSTSTQEEEDDDAFFAGLSKPKATVKKQPVKNMQDKIEPLDDRVPPPMNEDVFKKKPTKKANANDFIFGDDSDDDLFSSVKTPAKSEATSSSLAFEPPPIPSLDDDDDIFSVKKTQTKAEKATKPESAPIFGSTDDSDIFGSSPEKGNVGKAGTEKDKDDKSISVVASKANEDDIFGSLKIEKKTSDGVDDLFSSKSAEPEKKITKSISLDDDEDLFGATAVEPKKKIEISKEEDIFGSSVTNRKEKPKKPDDDDDIFGSKTTGVTAKPKPTKVSILDDSDDDDIFGTTSKAPPRKLQKAKTKDEDLFKDDTDIFADLGSSKAKSKKKKTKGDSLFGDDDDDIFADKSSKAKPKKKAASKSVSAKKEAKKEPDDIFDDPLSAGLS